MARFPDEYESRISFAFQKRILKLIDEQMCSKKNFSLLVGVNKEVITRATVYAIIPSVRSLIKIADSLDLSFLYLLGETDENIFYKTENPTTFHIRIEELRKERKTKYSIIAAKMSFQKNSFYEWIRTNSLPSLEYLKEIAKYFSVSIDYLLGRTDERKN